MNRQIGDQPLPPDLADRFGDYVRASNGDIRVSAWLWAACNIAMLSPQFAVPFVEHLADLLPSQPAEVIADAGTTLSYVSKELATLALAKIDRRAILATQDESTREPAEIAKTFAKLVWVDKEFQAFLGGGFLDVFPAIDAQELPFLLSRISWGHPDVGKRLIDECDPNDISSLLRSTQSAAARYRALAAIATSSIKAAKAVVSSLIIDLVQPEVGFFQLCNRIVDAEAGGSSVVHVSRMTAEDLIQDPVNATAQALQDASRKGMSCEDLTSYLSKLRASNGLHDEAELLLAFLSSGVVPSNTEERMVVEKWFKETTSTLALTQDDAYALKSQMSLIGVGG
jgi:hypothetical protein